MLHDTTQRARSSCTPVWQQEALLLLVNTPNHTTTNLFSPSQQLRGLTLCVWAVNFIALWHSAHTLPYRTLGCCAVAASLPLEAFTRTIYSPVNTLSSSLGILG